MENQNSKDLNPTPPVSPVVQAPVSNPVSNIEKPKSKFPLAIIIGIILLLLIVGSAAGFYVFKHQGNYPDLFAPKPPVSIGMSSSPTVTTSQQVIIPQFDQTKNWKIYTTVSNSSLSKIGVNFSIKYPNNWYANDSNPHHTSGIPWVVFSAKPIQTVTDRISQCVGIGGGLWPNTLSLDQIINSVNGSFEIPTSPGKFKKIATKVLSKENVIVNAMSGIMLQTQSGDQQPIWQTFIKQGTTVFILDSCQNTNKDVYEQVLSTFKPGASNQTINISNWKTYYTNDFSFKYPPTIYSVTSRNNSITLLPSTFSDTSSLDYYPITFTISSLKNYPNASSDPQSLFGNGSIPYRHFLLKNKTPQTITIAGVKGYMINEIGAGTVGIDEEIVFTKDNNLFDIVVENSLGKNRTVYQNTVNQILSTLQFTTPTPTCMPRPACLDANPRCMIAEPANGWCK